MYGRVYMYTSSVCKSTKWHRSSCTIFNLLVFMIAKYLLFFWSNVLVLTPQDFRYSFKTCPALGGGTLAPFLLIWYSLAFSDQFTVFQSFTSSISCSRFPSTVLGMCDLFCCLGAFFTLLLASSMVSKHSTILCLFLAAKDFRWARWRLTSLFFPGIFYIFLKFSLFFTDFFFCLNRWNFLCQPSLGNHGHSFSKGLSQLLLTCRVEFLIYYWPYVFHFFFCWFEDFFFLEALWLDFLLLWMPPFGSPHNLCFFWRGYSLLVLLRDNICILLLGAQFFLPWAVFSQLSINAICV